MQTEKRDRQELRQDEQDEQDGKQESASEEKPCLSVMAPA
jgi:hypothetical protein